MIFVAVGILILVAFFLWYKMIEPAIGEHIPDDWSEEK